MVTDGLPKNFARFFVKTCGVPRVLTQARPSSSRRRRQRWHRWTHDDQRMGHLASLCDVSPNSVSQGHHQRRLAARLPYDEAYATRMPEIGAPPAAFAWADLSTRRTAPPSRKPRGLRPALSPGKLSGGVQGRTTAVAGFGGASVLHPRCMLHSMATRWGHHPPARPGPPLCALRPASWPGGVASGSRRVREAFLIQGVWEA
jgi:hypothetical protein